MVEHKVEAKVAEVKAKLATLGYADIPLKVKVCKLKGTYAGYATYATLEVAFDTEYLLNFEDEMLNETVPHEVVHHYIKKYYPRAKQAHGPEFRRLMRAIGAIGSTKHAMKLESKTKNRRTKTRYIYITPTSKEIFLTKKQHERHQAGLLIGKVIYYASKGKEPITFTGRMMQTK